MSKVNLIEISSIISQKKGLDTTDLDGESVMMDIDKGKYYNFNSVGSRIWELIEKPISIKEIIAQLLKEFDIDEKKCEAAVINFVDRLNDNELIAIA
ncbi:lasso peptide biosynthesis PqqD family chaperone [Clostridium sp.]|jgi:hypothetical protein|uniref:lasso peptide biosynthesis PqqD family chaperone n=1 Tax=Clostridium sp. TaxID=1506 RepID=UPI00258E1950|nr:lasso peptide biosynthesis PqqD family chaperone [Clostridium sp.]MDF2505650.1 PqqD family protein [Clostridium sp.]